MGLDFTRGIADPVHGTIRITKIENEVIDTPAFQRLRNVAQLGLASYVFPGANFSRFSHSLGACHVAGRVLARFEAAGESMGDEETQLYRLAALLHDVGHYPYSHTFEHALKTHYSEKLLGGGDPEDPDAAAHLDHEGVGEKIIETDPVIVSVLSDAGIDPTQVSGLLVQREKARLADLISSDLDVDRIDYLMRTCLHTGLPYGHIDLDYLIGQLALDNDGRICIRENALRAADHFLLARVFDRQQVAWHKTVAALETLLEEVISDVLGGTDLDCSKKAIIDRIKASTWDDLDDAALLTRIRQFKGSLDQGDPRRLKAEAVLRRRPPKLLGQVEFWAQRDDPVALGDFKDTLSRLKELKTAWASELGIDESLWFVWKPKQLIFTDRPPGGLEPEEEAVSKMVHILRRGSDQGVPIWRALESLMCPMWKLDFRTLRLYVLLPDGKEGSLEAIKERVAKDMLATPRFRPALSRA